LTYRKES